MQKVQVQRLPHAREIPLPSYRTSGASGIDLAAAIDEPVVFEPGQFGLVPTGFVFDIPRGFEGQVRARSGLSSKHGFTVLNGPGTIDSDFRGELKVIAVNFGPSPFIVEPKMRIAQMVFAAVARMAIDEVHKLTETERGTGGFGSTGI